MLRGMRKASSNWLGRAVMGVVLGLIAVSFAIWGIGDIFRGFGRSTVAKVGSTEITIDQFRQTYNDRLQQLSRQIGRPITPDQARLLNLDQQLIGQLIAEAAIDQRARQLRLNISDAAVAKQIMADSNFKGPGGQFDRARFEAMIRQAGYNEPRYAAEQKRLTMRRELAETIGGDLTLPKTYADAYNRYENEQRAIDYVTLDRAKAGDIAPPAPEVLEKYFSDNKAQFRAPEYRSLAVMALTPADVIKPQDVSEADARQYYDRNQSRFGSPERRDLQQISFPNEDEAKAAAQRLGAELSFEALAKERGLTEKDIALGLETKAGIIDKAVAEAAFALKEGETSAAVKGTFGTVLIHVIKIEPATIKSFEEVMPAIKQQIAIDRSKSELSTRRDKIEDERAGGLRLTEVAQKFGMTAATIEAVDRKGLDPAGSPVAGLPPGADVITAAFGSEVGVENEPVQLQGGGFVWYEVLKVTPPREQALEEVRAKVEESWRNDQVSEKLKAKAAELVEKLKGGAALNDLATADGLTVQTSFGIKRAGNTVTVPPRVAQAVFQLEKDQPGSAEGNPGEWVVFRLTDITVPALDTASADGKRIDENVKRGITEDFIGQYVQQLKKDLGATVNLNVVRQVSSGGNVDADQN
ncbi:MAG: peptidyl-prolyl cis-trans isomerase [Hyphomicrobiales bacterium]